MSTHLLIVYSILTVILAGGVGLAGGFVNARHTILERLSIVGTILLFWNLVLAFTLITDTFPSELPFGLFLFSAIASIAYTQLCDRHLIEIACLHISEANTENEMRIPLDSEWDRLVELTDGDNAKIHWDKMASWVNDPENKRKLPPEFQTYRGCDSARDWSRGGVHLRIYILGFRPAYIPGPDTPLSEVKEGESAVIGTLYMGGEPVKVPQKPTYNGDIEDYIPDATLELREPLDNPAYQVVGIRVGNIFIADRCLLKNISFEDIEDALF